jgi:uncharacterized membrane-anchored protein
MLSKVPEITAFFWIIKLLSTAGGETTADLFAHTNLLKLSGALVFSTVLLVVALVVQLLVRRYVPIVYWSVIVAIGIAGTLISDGVVDFLHLSHLQATGVFLALLLAVFGVWYATERTLSIHSITTTRRELYYWAAVMATFSLGTAAGDLTAFSLGWGFIPSLVLYGVVFAVAGVGALAMHRAGSIGGVIGFFWLAYVMTRPLGATFADYTAMGKDIGGLGLGLLLPSAAFLLVIGALVLYLQVTHKDGPDAAAVRTRRH